ncbi:MAG: iron-containing alcohol dehydrogenase [bacterium]|nr:iron-containing alcohol dehydrogenase [bacterium]
MRTTWSFSTAGRLLFGVGAIKQLGDTIKPHRPKRCLIVTDRILIEAGIVGKAETSLEAAGVAYDVFSEGEAEPSIRVAEAAIELAKDRGADLIIGIGGGSNMDLAKIVAAVVAHGGHPRDYFGVDQIPGPVLPLICVPTTAGTGSEVSHAAVLTDTDAAMKVSTISQWLRPTVALVDPELTYSCPPTVTADSGIDALTHAVEACTATHFSKLSTESPVGYEGTYPLGVSFAEQAIRLISEHLQTACKEPDNVAAREGMAYAATLAGMAFSNCGVALVHALEYPLGGELHCSHGAGNGLLLPYVMRFNLPDCRDMLANIADWMGVDTAEMDSQQAAEAAIDAVTELRLAIGVPDRIRELGGTREQLPNFAHKTFALARLRAVNPRDYSEQDLLELLESAF